MSFVLSRATVDRAVALAGAALVIAQLTLLAYSPVHVSVVIIGVILLYVGIWRRFSRWLPDRRINRPLRAGVERFNQLVRRLNDQSAAGEDSAATETAAALRETVERVIRAAGVEQAHRSQFGSEAGPRALGST